VLYASKQKTIIRKIVAPLEMMTCPSRQGLHLKPVICRQTVGAVGLQIGRNASESQQHLGAEKHFKKTKRLNRDLCFDCRKYRLEAAAPKS
jgi:hypothetical protein